MGPNRKDARRITFGAEWRAEKTYNRGVAMRVMAGATTLGDLASAIGVRDQESAIVAELKAGSEDAYAWLIGEFHQPIYNLVYRIVADPSDAADTTQEVFLKVFRGMKHFHGESSLKTWIYRIALHEAYGRKRFAIRHVCPRRSSQSCGTGTTQGTGTIPQHANFAGSGRNVIRRSCRDHASLAGDGQIAANAWA